MKTLILAGTLALFSHTTNANDIVQIDQAANAMDISQLQSLSHQNQDYTQAYANYRLAISANILGQPKLAGTALNNAQSNLEDHRSRTRL